VTPILIVRLCRQLSSGVNHNRSAFVMNFRWLDAEDAIADTYDNMEDLM
jgi:hypothetical protein